VQLQGSNNGFQGQGNMRVQSVNKYNLVNGGLSMTVDLSGVQP
jgi:hypothetical protein